MNRLIVHISEVDISPETGMGRVEWHWKNSFEKAGYIFLHIGPKEVGKLKHRALFPFRAYEYFLKLRILPRAIIAHEPASGMFVKKKIPCFVESHGVERKIWERRLANLIPMGIPSLRTRLLYPLWRLRNCDKGLRHAHKLLLINSSDKEFVQSRYHRKEEDIFLFRNGIHRYPERKVDEQTFTILFNGGWIERKGISTLLKAAKIMAQKNLPIRYLIIGTNKAQNTVLNEWPADLQGSVQVVPRYNQQDEQVYLAQSSIFVLPSFSEGQPLSLLQAMAAGKCCITTNCDGQKDIVKDGETGVLFEAGDHEQLAALIHYYYINPEKRKIIGDQAKNYILNYSWEAVSDTVSQYVLNNS